MAARGALVFALVFLALPLAGLLAAILLGGGVALAISSVALVVTGFTIAFAFVDW